MKEIIISLSLGALALFAIGGFAAGMRVIKNIHEEIEEPEEKEQPHLFI